MALGDNTGVFGPLVEAVKVDKSNSYKQLQPIWQSTDFVYEMNDFLDETDIDITNNWTSTETEAGASDTAITILAGSVNGILSIVNDVNDNDATSLQKKNETWKLVAGKKLWFETLMNVSDADQTDLFVGLSITDTSPLDASDFVGFKLVDGNASILCKTCKNSTETSTDSGVDAEDATNVRLGFFCDGVGKVEFYVNRNLVATHTANIVDDEELAMSIHYQNGNAATHTLLMDYYMIAKDR
jgi:hypothetical protein